MNIYLLVLLIVLSIISLILSIISFTKCLETFGDGFKINGNIEYGKLQNDDYECVVQYPYICNKSCFECNQNSICPKDKTCKEGVYTPGKGTCIESGKHNSEVICGN